tara:strand:- start:13 stop:261 length:249 start_codon:yes stop_codon:yes gene_type:complete
MTQDEKYTEEFKKALNNYIELGFNQDECNGFMHGFHKGAQAKQLILSGVVKSFFCNNCHSERYRMLTPITYQCKDCDTLQAK